MVKRFRGGVKSAVAERISQILRKRLQGENLSQVARELGISKSLLADWVSSRRLPSLRNIGAVVKLAGYLGLTLEELLLGDVDSQKTIGAISFEDENRHYRVNIKRLK